MNNRINKDIWYATIRTMRNTRNINPFDIPRPAHNENFIIFTLDTPTGTIFVLHNPNLRVPGEYNVAALYEGDNCLRDLFTRAVFDEHNVVNWDDYFGAP